MKKTNIFIVFAVIFMSLILVVIFKDNFFKRDIENSISKAIDFLKKNQLDYGEFKTLACDEEKMENCYFDSAPLVTALVVYSLKNIGSEDAVIIKNKALDFLQNEQEKGGIWRYWSSKNTEHVLEIIAPDLDDTSVVSFVLKNNGKTVEDNKQLLSDNKNKGGLFFTWIGVPEDENNIDCVVNANVLLYENKNDLPVCEYINDAIINNKSCSIYYQNKLTLYYMASRAFENGISCLKESKETTIKSVLDKQNRDGSFGNDMDTALALNTLFNFNYRGEEIGLGIKNLLWNQGVDGSWRKEIFFVDSLHYNYGSEELTTALAIEAMGKY